VTVVFNRLPGLSKRLRAALAHAQEAGADEAVQVAQDLVAVDTGALQSTIRKEWGPGTSVSVTAGGMPTEGHMQYVDYAGDQEFGTRYQSGTPYLRPAAEAARRRVKFEVHDAVEVAVRAGGFD
jgi:hypothetical protein